MICDLISPSTSYQVEDAHYVQVPGTKGLFGILQKHAPLVSSLEPGIVKIIRSGNAELLFTIPAGGFVEVNDNVITIIAESVSQTF
ncbi:MAG: F0F1 ATP synthase subunit epsilon [Bacteroidales bacterium]|nr:F0F1 ATP synthase subunit epsilon [Bacteroidales bacterium]